jgi:hypothetical protein
MKYDDASWHFGGNFPKDSPPEYGGTHIAILLKWCFVKGWAGELHLEENIEDVNAVINGTKSATDFFFQWCDGKFTDEDLTDEGNAFIGPYYDKTYLSDYADLFADLMFVAPESKHEQEKLSELLEKRYKKFTNSEPAQNKPWWKLW